MSWWLNLHAQNMGVPQKILSTSLYVWKLLPKNYWDLFTFKSSPLWWNQRPALKLVPMPLSEGTTVPLAVGGGLFLHKNTKVYTTRVKNIWVGLGQGLSLQQGLLCWYGLKFCPLEPSVLFGDKRSNQSCSLWECWVLLVIPNRNHWPFEPEQELMGSTWVSQVPQGVRRPRLR